MKLHAIAGLPRSGSTLLCNILAQNPAFHVSSTNNMAGTLIAMGDFWAGLPEIQADLHKDKQATEARLANCQRAVAHTWYADHDDKTIFDKSRAWNIHPGLFSYLFEGRLIICVRNPLDVLASIEKQNARYPVLDHDVGLGRTHLARMHGFLGPKGMVGTALTCVEDMIRTDRPGLAMMQYEFLVANPERALAELYEEIGAEPFAHNFEEIESAATELDALYLNKFPHDGGGPVQERDSEADMWVAKDIQKRVLEAWPLFNQTFGYGG